ncbi:MULTISPECIES: methyltransferase domain-containing protein [unclassified Streptomyces]|uniref:methyltransferase domain-containing protein n=1 Tax=unclassified Streptomyces TaxID=2593676 RepID=UPI0006FED299|nr:MULTISPECIES: methyltransferase domain-containing protein [unclassified Streptomyces]KQX50770.1 methyltransferase [Streptomyces sp. Root1304]KRA84935.1 methyltransferase [Streptomyces sp. Root66D1]
MSNTHVHGDSAGRAAQLIALLDTLDVRPDARRLRERSYALLEIRPGVSVVDVGCGAGRAVAEMADLGARATGVDVSAVMLAEAGRRRPDGDFRRAGADRLPFADGELDAYRADKLLHELDDPARAVAEARRVLAPGGRAVLVGQDWDSFVLDSDAAALTRAVVHARADAVPGPRAVRRYRSLLLDAGFRDVEVEVHTGVFTTPAALPMLDGLAQGAYAAGAITRRQADDWMAEQRARADADRLFLAMPFFVASATRA